jgi:general secretion pathway protein J
LLFTGISGGLSAVSHALRRAETRVGKIEDMAAAQETLRNEVSRTYPQFIGATRAQELIDFTGAADRVQFLAPLPARFGAADIVRWDLVAAGGKLILGWRLDRSSPSGFPAEERADTVLLQGVTGIKIGYFGRDGQGGPPSWHDDWFARKALPDLIRIEVEPAALGWSSLFIAPRLQAAADCLFDPSNSLGCLRQ